MLYCTNTSNNDNLSFYLTKTRSRDASSTDRHRDQGSRELSAFANKEQVVRRIAKDFSTAMTRTRGEKTTQLSKHSLSCFLIVLSAFSSSPGAQSNR